MDPAKPGWLAIVQCPDWRTWHVVMVDAVDEEGYVILSHNGLGESFVTERAGAVTGKAAALPYIRALPYPYATQDEAADAVKAERKRRLANPVRTEA